MIPKITNEMRRALEQQSGKLLTVEDDQTQKIYVLVPQEDFPRLVDEELRRQLQIGFNQRLIAGSPSRGTSRPPSPRRTAATPSWKTDAPPSVVEDGIEIYRVLHGARHLYRLL